MRGLEPRSMEGEMEGEIEGEVMEEEREMRERERTKVVESIENPRFN